VIYEGTYCLVPCPISGHEILIFTISIDVVVTKWGRVHFSIEICICKHVLDDFMRVAVPNIMLREHPRWRLLDWKRSFVLDLETRPWNVSGLRFIDSLV
jgi:hypothetical protein